MNQQLEQQQRLNLPKENSDKKKEGIQHKTRLEESLKERWESKAIHGQGRHTTQNKGRRVLKGKMGKQSASWPLYWKYR
jgi:hypothetical protein